MDDHPFEKFTITITGEYDGAGPGMAKNICMQVEGIDFTKSNHQQIANLIIYCAHKIMEPASEIMPIPNVPGAPT